MMAARPLLLAGVSLTLIGLSAVVRSDPLLLWNASGSAPIGLYAVTPVGDLHRGALVAVRPPPPLERWLVDNGFLGSGALLLKRAAAMAGAKVCRDGATISVAGKIVATARERDQQGRLLPVWTGCRSLGNEVFLLNVDEPDSLDGRYFGPLGIDTIVGRATPLWTTRP